MTVCLLRGPLSVKGRKRQFFRFLIDVAGKRRKSKDVFEITGRLLSETAVKGNGNDWCRLVTHNRCKRVKGTGTPVYRRSLIVCTHSLVFRCALPKAFALLGYNTHPKLRLHEQPCINVSFSIFCSLFAVVSPLLSSRNKSYRGYAYMQESRSVNSRLKTQTWLKHDCQSYAWLLIPAVFKYLKSLESTEVRWLVACDGRVTRRI